jgi:hypothetical protein
MVSEAASMSWEMLEAVIAPLQLMEVQPYRKMSGEI